MNIITTVIDRSEGSICLAANNNRGPGSKTRVFAVAANLSNQPRQAGYVLCQTS